MRQYKIGDRVIIRGTHFGKIVYKFISVENRYTIQWDNGNKTAMNADVISYLNFKWYYERIKDR